MKPPQLILAVSVLLALLLPAVADHHQDDRDDAVHRRTRGEVREFLEKHLPDALRHLKHAEEEGHHEEIEEFWQGAGELVGEFHLTREELGEDAARTLLRLHQLQLRADSLTERFHDLDDGDEEEAGKIKAELREVIGAHLKLSWKLEEFHLAQARKELAEAARELAETAAHHEEIIEEELAQRLHGDEEEDDDHREDDGDDDEEGEGEDDEHEDRDEEEEDR